METPNKIYIPKEEVIERKEYLIEPYPEDGWDECYIRKDAILDIIKDQKKIAMGFSYEHLKMLEDKINSL